MFWQDIGSGLARDVPVVLTATATTREAAADLLYAETWSLLLELDAFVAAEGEVVQDMPVGPPE